MYLFYLANHASQANCPVLLSLTEVIIKRAPSLLSTVTYYLAYLFFFIRLTGIRKKTKYRLTSKKFLHWVSGKTSDRESGNSDVRILRLFSFSRIVNSVKKSFISCYSSTKPKNKPIFNSLYKRSYLFKSKAKAYRVH